MTRPLVEHRPSFDIRALCRAGRISAGERSVTLAVQEMPDGTVHLTTVSLIEHTRGQIGGGARRYFCCPCCRRKCDLVYLNGNSFTCRRCAGLAYASENRTRLDRAASKIFKLRRRLGQQPRSLLDPLPDKPKWQRWRTYDRTIARLAAAETAHVRRFMMEPSFVRHQKRMSVLRKSRA